MLRIIRKIGDLDFSQLMEVYAQENGENAWERDTSIWRREWEFAEYLREVFFQTPGAFYGVWAEAGRYIAALRLEPYQDGLLLEGLETRLDCRRRGYAKKLLLAVLELLAREENMRVYSHVEKRNTASLGAHRACGFRQAFDYARMLDGSVSSRYVTLVWESSQQ